MIASAKKRNTCTPARTRPATKSETPTPLATKGGPATENGSRFTATSPPANSKMTVEFHIVLVQWWILCSAECCFVEHRKRITTALVFGAQNSAVVKAERITGVVLCSTKSYLFYRVNFIGNSTGQLFSNATCKYGVILDKHCVVLQSSTGIYRTSTLYYQAVSLEEFFWNAG